MGSSETRQTPSLRERRNQKTRRAIVLAAAELTLEGSFAAATIPRIAERAEIAPRTVSGWFPVKDEILFADSAEYIGVAARHFEQGAGDTIDRLRAWLEDETERQLTDGVDLELERLKFRAIEHDPVLRARSIEHFGAIHGLIAASVARDTGGSAEEQGPQLFAGAAISMLRVLQAAGLEPITRDEIEARFEQGFAFLRAGLATLLGGDSA
jgi:AcrR family transcriptional regulator